MGGGRSEGGREGRRRGEVRGRKHVPMCRSKKQSSVYNNKTAAKDCLYTFSRLLPLSHGLLLTHPPSFPSLALLFICRRTKETPRSYKEIYALTVCLPARLSITLPAFSLSSGAPHYHHPGSGPWDGCVEELAKIDDNGINIWLRCPSFLIASIVDSLLEHALNHRLLCFPPLPAPNVDHLFLRPPPFSKGMAMATHVVSLSLAPSTRPVGRQLWGKT